MKKKIKKILAKIKEITNLKKQANCGYFKLLKKLHTANKYNISAGNFKKYECWLFTENELKDLSEALKMLNEKTKSNKEWYRNVLCEKTGCSMDEVKKRFNIAYKKGYTSLRFIKSGNYKLTVEELQKLPRYVHPEHEDSVADIRIRESRQHYIDTMMAEMNWTYPQVLINHLKSYVNCGCSFHEYFVFKLYSKSFEEQRKFITTELWVKLYLRYCDYADTWKYFKSKALFNEKFKDYISREWCISDDITEEKFNDYIKNKSNIIFKPLDAQCGIGIQKYAVNESEEENQRIYKEISSIRSGVLEDIIKQHADINKLTPYSINTIRVQTLLVDGKPEVLNACIRMGRDESQFTDNFAAGGLVASIDLSTGMIFTDAVTKFGEVYETHPATGTRFKGYQLPCWDKIMQLCKDAALEVPTMPYIGWDVVINDDGSIQFIEGNHDAGAVMHQYPLAVTEGIGIRDTIEKYIWF